ncbi:MAG TPA: AraC family transcriptional regulator [Terriglobales bacterium]|nr:AraC family transcriptional regulator [Terriglobales bacterium]
MSYRQIQPPFPVSTFVQCYWLLEDDSPPQSSVQRIVPDGCPELILNLGRPFEGQKEGRWYSQPQFFFAGQITRPMFIRSNGAAKVLGVRFHPFGARRILKVSAHETTDLLLPLEDVAPRLYRKLHHLFELDSTPQQLAFVDQVLRETSLGKEDSQVEAAVNWITSSPIVADLDRVATIANLSVRQFQRRFKDEVGMSPKLFCRIQRFQRVFQALNIPNSSWVDAALHCGYYDQSHLIRDFKDFSAETPAVLLAAESDLAVHFLQNSGMSHFSNTARDNSL